MASGEQKKAPRRARNRNPYGAAHSAHHKLRSRSRRDPRPSLLGAGTRTGDPTTSSSPSRPRPSGRRNNVVALSGLNVLAGVWLIIAPWVLGYSTNDPRWNDVAFGIVIGVLALIRMAGAHRSYGLSLVNAMIGLWLAVAAFTIDHTIAATWNDIVLGAIVYLLAISSTGATLNRLARRGPGTTTAARRGP
jgi:hypothetical protein